MNLPANFPLKKVMITVVSVVIVIALIITCVTVAVNGKAANATVDVEQVSNISTQYWGDQSSTYGNATSDFVQELYPDKEKAISKIFVKEGDTVKIGDTLLQYDTTKLQLKVESKELEEKKKKYELEQAEKELTKLQNTAPYVEPVIPEPEPEPTPTPVPESQAELYTEITEHSKPFKGAGTEEDPYVFLCTEDAVLTKGFLLKLLGVTDQIADPGIDISSWQSIFQDLMERDYYIILEDENNGQLEIGRITKVLKDRIYFLSFDADGVWAEANEEFIIRYGQITTVRWETRYVERWRQYLEGELTVGN